MICKHCHRPIEMAVERDTGKTIWLDLRARPYEVVSRESSRTAVARVPGAKLGGAYPFPTLGFSVDHDTVCSKRPGKTRQR